MNSTNTESTTIKLFNYIVKYNNETSRLLDLLLLNTLSILFRVCITLLQLFLLCGFGCCIIFIPLLLMIHINTLFY